MRTAKFAIAILYVFFAAANSYAEPVKTATVDRLLQREHIHNVVIDDKRNLIFFERLDAAGSSTARFPYTEPFSVARALSKIYVASMDGNGEARPLFEQDAESGYYFTGNDPWSPDGRYLSIYKLTEGRVRAGIYDLRRRRSQFFEVEARYKPGRSSITWLSKDEFAMVGNGDMKSPWLDTVRGARGLAAGREKGWRGGEVTAEVIGSGKYIQPRMALDTFEIVRVNVRTGHVHRLAEAAGPVLFAPYKFGGKVVMREDVLTLPGEGGAMKQNIISPLSIMNMRTGEKSDIAEIHAGGMSFISWSGSGAFFLVQQRIEGEPGKKAEHRHLIIDTDSAKVVKTLPRGASNSAWIGDTLAYSPSDKIDDKLDNTDEGNPDSLKAIAVAINSPRPIASSDGAVYYLKEGDLWREGLTEVRENLTKNYAHAISLYKRPNRYWLDPSKSSNTARTPLLEEINFVADIAGSRSLVKFATNGRSFSVFGFPQEDSVLLAASPEGAIFLTNSNDVGSQLQYVRAGEKGAPRLLYHFNKHLAGVETAVGPIRIEHKAYDGQNVNGWLYLPPGASLDRPQQFPMVMIPYGGSVYDDEPGQNFSGKAAKIWNLLLSANIIVEVFAAEGYAVLLPSMPVNASGRPGEPMQEMLPAMLTSLDAAIETGFVDPQRLAISGHSYGGYNVLSALAQTSRFRAGVAFASPTNLISKYGQFLAHTKVDSNRVDPPGASGMARWSEESSQGGMRAPPWEDPERHTRNSPLFHVNKISSPVLLMHGDTENNVPVEQSEEMFSALYREDKDAIFVRYFGEGHSIEQPQNQRDMWRRVFSFLKDNGVTSGPQPIR